MKSVYRRILAWSLVTLVISLVAFLFVYVWMLILNERFLLSD